MLFGLDVTCTKIYAAFPSLRFTLQSKYTIPFVEVNTLSPKEINEGFTARTVHTGSMSFVYGTVKAGASMLKHQHIHMQVPHVRTGQFEFTVDGDTKLLEPGIVAIPSNAQQGGKALIYCLLPDVFEPEREEYKF